MEKKEEETTLSILKVKLSCFYQKSQKERSNEKKGIKIKWSANEELQRNLRQSRRDKDGDWLQNFWEQNFLKKLFSEKYCSDEIFSKLMNEVKS